MNWVALFVIGLSVVGCSGRQYQPPSDDGSCERACEVLASNDGWCNETGQDPVVLLRAIELDGHRKVDAAIYAEIATTYAEIEKV